jgi:hypothetical protein
MGEYELETQSTQATIQIKLFLVLANLVVISWLSIQHIVYKVNQKKLN